MRGERGEDVRDYYRRDAGVANLEHQDAMSGVRSRIVETLGLMVIDRLPVSWATCPIGTPVSLTFSRIS